MNLTAAAEQILWTDMKVNLRRTGCGGLDRPRCEMRWFLILVWYSWCIRSCERDIGCIGYFLKLFLQSYDKPGVLFNGIVCFVYCVGNRAHIVLWISFKILNSLEERHISYWCFTFLPRNSRSSRFLYFYIRFMPNEVPIWLWLVLWNFGRRCNCTRSAGNTIKYLRLFR